MTVLDDWMPRIPEDVDAQISTWKDYILEDLERLEKERKEKEALELAKVYFGE